MKADIKFYSADCKDLSIIAYGWIKGKKVLKIDFTGSKYRVFQRSKTKYHYLTSYPAELMLHGVIDKIKEAELTFKEV
jgi:hypothetical protein